MFKNNSEPMGIQNSFHSMEIISRSSKWLYLIFAANLLIFTLPSYGKAVDVRFSKPIADGTVKIKYSCGGQTDTLDVKIAKGSAKDKRKKISDALKKEKYDVKDIDDDGNVGIKISNLCENGKLEIDAGKTGEEDQKIAKEISYAALTFDPSYNSLGLDGNPAIFSVGIVTDQGQFKSTYRANVRDDEKIDGQILADWLFGNLMGPASEIGASLERNGNQIVVNFADDVSTEGAGISFQSTSTNGTIRGAIEPGSEDSDEFIVDNRAGVFAFNGSLQEVDQGLQLLNRNLNGEMSTRPFNFTQ